MFVSAHCHQSSLLSALMSEKCCSTIREVGAIPLLMFWVMIQEYTVCYACHLSAMVKALRFSGPPPSETRYTSSNGVMMERWSRRFCSFWRSSVVLQVSTCFKYSNDLVTSPLWRTSSTKATSKCSCCSRDSRRSSFLSFFFKLCWTFIVRRTSPFRSVLRCFKLAKITSPVVFSTALLGWSCWQNDTSELHEELSGTMFVSVLSLH